MCCHAVVAAVRRFTKPLVAIMICQMLIAYSYFISSAVFVQYLSANLGLDDIQASVLYSAFGVLIAIFGIFTGLIVDHMRTFTGLALGAILALVGRALYVALPHIFEPTRAIIGSTVLLSTCIPLGESLMAQMCMIGIKRYATPTKIYETPGIRDSHSGAFACCRIYRQSWPMLLSH